VTLAVGPSGKVSKATTSEEIGVDLDLEACVRRQAATWKFPAPTDAGKPVKARFELGLEFSATYKPGVHGGGTPPPARDPIEELLK
jgi:hypothetical protein